MKKVLIITYYFPPSGGSGVQRILKFIKYLPLFGWQPVVYTVKNGEYPIMDESLMKDIPDNIEIIRSDIWEPYNIYKKFTGQQSDSKISPGFLQEKNNEGFSQKISQWIRGNIFIPDARKFWIKPSIRFLKNYLSENPVDAIISSGPPHSVHLIALALKKKFNLAWIADFRDPWTNIYYYEKLKLSKLSHERNKKYENEVIKNADAIIVVGNRMKNDFEEIKGKDVYVITNGFDEDDITVSDEKFDDKFSLVYTGYLLADENPAMFWKALSELCSESSDFASSLELKFIGKVDAGVKENLKNSDLEKHASYFNYLPHSQVFQYQKKAQVLLLLLNDTEKFRRILTGKLFEYLAAGRPILCIGSVDGDAADIIRETGSGYIFRSDDLNSIREKLLDFYNQYKTKTLYCNNHGIEKYSRKNLTKSLAEILNKFSKTS